MRKRTCRPTKCACGCKNAIFAGLHTRLLWRFAGRHHGDSLYDRAFAKPWNNARLNTVAPPTTTLVPAFERLLRREHGNLPGRFTPRSEKMRHLSKAQRRARLGE